jgi:hypothetical protein
MSVAVTKIGSQRVASDQGRQRAYNQTTQTLMKESEHSLWGDRLLYEQCLGPLSRALFPSIEMSRDLNWSLGGSWDNSAKKANSLWITMQVTMRTGWSPQLLAAMGSLVTKCSGLQGLHLSSQCCHVNNESIGLFTSSLAQLMRLTYFLLISLILPFYSRNNFWTSSTTCQVLGCK